jgi:hypothetical protein
MRVTARVWATAAAAAAVALATGCGGGKPLTAGTGHPSSAQPPSSSASPGSASPGSANPGSGGTTTAPAQDLIVQPSSLGLATCWAGSTPAFIASGLDPDASRDQQTWKATQAHGGTSSWTDFYDAQKSNCQAALSGQSSRVKDIVIESIYTFRTAAEARQAFDTDLFNSAATGPPTPQAGSTVGTGTGLGASSELGPTLPNGDIPAVWARGNVFCGLVAPTNTQTKLLSQQIQAKI